jgi:hypothetical protein
MLKYNILKKVSYIAYTFRVEGRRGGIGCIIWTDCRGEWSIGLTEWGRGNRARGNGM